MMPGEASQLQIELEAFPRLLRPMQPVAAEAPFSSPEYLFEVKWDGARAILSVDPDGAVRISDRGLNDLTPLLPELQAAAQQLPRGTILDGELVAADADGRPDLSLLRRRLSAGRRLAAETPLALLAFDVLYLEGKPQLRQPLHRRKAKLAKAVSKGGQVFVPEYITGDGVELFEACLEHGLEGVVGKHRDSLYIPGRRTPFWLTVTAVKSDDFVVIGSTHGAPFGALLVAYFEDGRLVPCGSVGGGFDPDSLRQLAVLMDELAVAGPLEPAPVVTAPVRWCRPEIVVSVRYSEWALDGTIRFPIFNGLRPDVHPAECIRNRPRVVSEGRARPGSPAHSLTRFPF